MIETAQNIATSPELWAAALQAFATLVAVGLAYWAALRQMRKQNHLHVGEDLRRRQADALQTAWSLLQHMTVVANNSNFLHYEQSPSTTGEKPQRSYSLHIAHAQAFVFTHLPNAFYANGAGLYWSSPIKDAFFECRSLLYGMLLAEKMAHPPLANAETSNSLRPIKKPELANRLETLYQQLNELLKNELQTVYAAN